MKVAALFVAKNGCYFGLPDVDPWDEERDARKYAGPWPVVAHPPCGTWGGFARRGMTLRPLGDDDGCFEAALTAVRSFGGVLEHPSQSSAWPTFALPAPTGNGGWQRDMWRDGWACEVEQGHYGHPCRKATWLYAVGVEPLPMRWGPSSKPLDAYGRLSHRQRAATPIPFRDLLLSIARTAQPRSRAA